MKTYVLADIVDTTAMVRGISRFTMFLLTGLSVAAVTATERSSGNCSSISNVDSIGGAPVISTGAINSHLSYGISVKNNTDTVQTYKYSYGESIMPSVAGLYRIYANISGGVTNSNSCTTAKLSPVFGDQDGDGVPEIQVLRFSSDGGVTFTNAGVDVGLNYETNRVGGHLYGVFSATIDVSPATSWNYWQIDTMFTLSPGDDVAVLTGYAAIVAIPEPATYILWTSVAALLGACFIGRKRAVSA